MTARPATPGIIGTLLASILTLTTIPVFSQGTPEEPLNVPFSLGRGFAVYEEHCAECHGARGDGSDQGPPLMHRYYEPGHHSDTAFLRAIRSGSQQHHWDFGDMPPVDEVNDEEARQVTAFVRWLQAERGIVPK